MGQRSHVSALAGMPAAASRALGVTAKRWAAAITVLTQPMDTVASSVNLVGLKGQSLKEHTGWLERLTIHRCITYMVINREGVGVLMGAD